MRQPPDHLHRRAAAWWASIAATFALEDSDYETLTLAAEQLSVAETARETFQREGVTMKDRFQQVREHPAVGIQRKATAEFRLMVRELGIHAEPPQEVRGPRGPQYGGTK